MDWLKLEIVDRPVSEWLVAAGVFAAIFLGVPIVRRAIRRRWDPSKHPASAWRALVGGLNARWWRLTTLVIAAAVGALVLRPGPTAETIARTAIVLVLTLQSLRLCGVIVDWLLGRISRYSGSPDSAEEADRVAKNTVTSLRWLGLGILYSLILLLALQNLGIDVTAMVAGLGIGGIAVALAIQNILGDLFASLTIALDRPFVVGDFIIVGSEMGVVEHVGLKTTRVRSLSGEQLVFGNSDLLSSRIRNFKRMNERRVVFGFGVVYDTGAETLERIPDIVRECVQSVQGVRFDRCHFFRFGASSLDFETVYYINTPDYNAHMDAQQTIHLAIMRRLGDMNVDFAFPTQTLHVVRSREQDTENGPAPSGSRVGAGSRSNANANVK